MGKWYNDLVSLIKNNFILSYIMALYILYKLIFPVATVCLCSQQLIFCWLFKAFCRVLELTQLSTCGMLLQSLMIQQMKGILLFEHPKFFYVLMAASTWWSDLIYLFHVGSLESPTWKDPLLNTYSDYEDSVYGNCYFLLLPSSFFVLSLTSQLNFRPYLEFSAALDFCVIVLWWKGKSTGIFKPI